MIEIVRQSLLQDNPSLTGMKMTSSSQIKKFHRGPKREIRLVYQHFGTIEGILHTIGLYQCEGHMRIELKNRKIILEGFLVANDAETHFLVNELIEEIQFILERLVEDFKDSQILLTIKQTQKPKKVEGPEAT